MKKNKNAGTQHKKPQPRSPKRTNAQHVAAQEPWWRKLNYRWWIFAPTGFVGLSMIAYAAYLGVQNKSNAVYFFEWLIGLFLVFVGLLTTWEAISKERLWQEWPREDQLAHLAVWILTSTAFMIGLLTPLIPDVTPEARFWSAIVLVFTVYALYPLTRAPLPPKTNKHGKEITVHRPFVALAAFFYLVGMYGNAYGVDPFGITGRMFVFSAVVIFVIGLAVLTHADDKINWRKKHLEPRRMSFWWTILCLAVFATGALVLTSAFEPNIVGRDLANSVILVVFAVYIFLIAAVLWPVEVIEKKKDVPKKATATGK